MFLQAAWITLKKYGFIIIILCLAALASYYQVGIHGTVGYGFAFGIWLILFVNELSVEYDELWVAEEQRRWQETKEE